MDRQRFFDEVVATGPVLFAGTSRPDAGVGMVRHWDVRSTAELEQVILRHAPGHNGYFCCASFGRGRWVDIDGKRRVGRRKAEVVAIKAFWADIDYKDGYGDRQAALVALLEVTRKLRLEPTHLVETGGGLHVYWVLVEELTREEWQPLADALKAGLITTGLLFDRTATADGARFLRVPDTINMKPSRNGFRTILHRLRDPIPVAELRTALNEYAQLNPPSSVVRSYQPAANTSSAGMTQAWLEKQGIGVETPISPEMAAAAAAAADDLTGGVAASKGPADFNLIVGRCAAMKLMVESGGADKSEPVFKDTLAVIAHCGDASRWAHAVAHKNAHYSPGSSYVDDKLAARHGTGPAKCTTFEAHPETAEACQGCIYRSLIGTPKQLGYDTFRAMKGFDVQPDGAVLKPVNTGTKDEPVWTWEEAFPEYRFRDYVLQEHGGDEGQTLHFNVDHRGQLKPCEIPVAKVVELRAFKTVVAPFMTGRDQLMNSLLDYKQGWISRLRNTTRHVGGSVQLGWQRRNGMDGFALGDCTLWANGTEERTQRFGGLSRYGSRGALQPWLDAARIVLAGPVELHIPLAVAAASPLVTLAGATGALVALQGGTGAGKTTAIKVAAAMFGEPKGTTVTATDTHNSIIERAALACNIFIPMDEIATGKDMRPLAEVGFQLIMGRSKARLAPNGQQLPTRNFASMSVIGTNARLREVMAAQSAVAEAGEARVIEVVVPQIVRVANPDISWRIGALDQNYGHGGRIYMIHVLKHRGAIEVSLKQVRVALAEQFPEQAELRYVLQAVELLIVGYAELGRATGLPVNIPAFVHMLIETAKGHGSTGSAANSMAIGRAAADTPGGAIELLHRFMEDRRDFILHSDDEHYHAPPTGMPKPARNGDRVRGPLAAHMVEGTATVYVSEDAVRRWAAANNIQTSTWMDSLWRLPACRGRWQVGLGRGVAGVVPIQTKVTAFDLTKLVP